MKIFWLLQVCTAIQVCSAIEWYEENDPHFVTDSQLKEMLQNDHTTVKIIKFFTPWCRYCRFMKSHFQNYKNSHEISKNLKFYQFNCMNENMRICGMNYRISGFPTIIAYGNDGKQINRISGMYPENMIFSFLSQNNNLANQIGRKINEEQSNQQMKVSNVAENIALVTQMAKNVLQLKDQQKTNNQNPDKQENKQEELKQEGSKQQVLNEALSALKSGNQEQSEKPETKSSQRISFSGIIKYLFYLFTAILGGYYGLHVFRHKYEDTNKQQKSSKNEKGNKFADSVQIEPNKQFDTEKDQLYRTEDVSDENL